MLSNIPDELKQLAQWVVCAHDKIPLNPRTLHAASVTNSKTWGTFDQAVAAVEAGKAEHVGFVLTESDPYVVVDLDNKVERPAPADVVKLHHFLADASCSYAELSMSERGYHIILRGTMPRAGVREDSKHLEMYASGRYMVMTGLVANAAPIVEHQEFIDKLYYFATKGEDDAEDDEVGGAADASISDDEVFRRAAEATGGAGERFLALWHDDDWQGKLPHLQHDNSRADNSLIEYLCYHSDSNDQVLRMFMACPLAQREKVQKRGGEYVMRSIRHVRRRLAKERAEQEALEREAEQRIANLRIEEAATPKPVPSPESNERTRARTRANVPLPPGLVGDIARYTVNSSRYSFIEAGLAVGLSVVSGIAGRTYTVSDTGLNSYILLLAATGVGKNSTHNAINALTNAVDERRGGMPGMEVFRGGHFRSGVAIRKALATQPCLLVTMPEVAQPFKRWIDPRASEHVRDERQLLLDVWSQSGPNGMLHGLRYSNKENDTQAVRSPCLTLLGEGVPEEVFDMLTSDLVTSGFLPRFSIIEYRGDRPDPNYTPQKEPPAHIVDRLTTLVEVAITAQANGTRHEIEMSSEAERMLLDFELECNATLRTMDNRATRELWNRAHLKAMRLAGVVAVGVNASEPLIDHTCAGWAIDFVRNEVSSLVAKFDKGEVGTGDDRAESLVRKAVEDWPRIMPEKRRSLGVTAELLETSRVIPERYLVNRLQLLEPFKSHPRKGSEAVRLTLAALVEQDVLDEVPRAVAQKEFKVRKSKLYLKGSAW